MTGRLQQADTVPANEAAGPIDLAHLDRATFGDRALRREVLTLFEGQASRLLREIAEAPDAKTRNDAAHTLKGAASGIGAFGVAQAAEAVENGSGDPAEALAILSARVISARLELSGLLARD